MVEIIVAYPCIIEAKSIEEALQIAEDAEWDDWPDDLAEIIEYNAEYIDEEEETNDNSEKSDSKIVKLTVVKGGA
jgi:hypothetical protein